MVNFIDKKNDLTENNAYVILLFSVMLAFFPYIYDSLNIIISHTFILLALRRIVSMRSMKTIKLKIFDAVFWISVASFFFSWSLLFLVLVFFAILLYAPRDYKNWLVPLLSIATVWILYCTVAILLNQPIQGIASITPQWDWDIDRFMQLRYMIPMGFLSVIGGWALLLYFLGIGEKSGKYQNELLIVISAFLIGVGIALGAEENHGAETMFIMFPLAVIIACFLEKIRRNWIRELIFWYSFFAIGGINAVTCFQKQGHQRPLDQG